jgi:hypothetical protein
MLLQNIILFNIVKSPELCLFDSEDLALPQNNVNMEISKSINIP